MLFTSTPTNQKHEHQPRITLTNSVVNESKGLTLPIVKIDLCCPIQFAIEPTPRQGFKVVKILGMYNSIFLKIM